MLRVASLVFAFLVSIIAAFAQSAAPADSRLKSIADAKVIRMAYRSDATPFSFVQPTTKEPTGFTVDLCRLVAMGIAVQLNIPDLHLEWVPVTVQNRFSTVAEGKADMECGASTITLGRMREVDFSNPVFVESTGIAVANASGISSVDRIAGKKIAVISGTTNEAALKSQIAARNLPVTLVTVADREAGIAALEGGQVDGFASDKLLLIGAQIKRPEALTLLPDDLSLELYGIALPRGDWAMRLAVNTALAHIYRSGKIVDVFGVWFGQIGMQPGTLLKAIYATGALPE
jgi:glutamate/aspartate transport system substrate-binding protein